VTALYLAATVALILGAIELVCRWIAHMPDPAEAQPDYVPLDEWAATAALDPRDSTDLPAGDDGPCEANPLIDEIYAYLKLHTPKENA
jgi:hypothetical protein